MAIFPPIKNSLYTLGNSRYRIMDVSISDNEVSLVKVDESGNELGAPITISKKKWESRDYRPLNDGADDSQKANDQKSNSQRFRFEFDPKTGEIIVTSHDGTVVARLDSIRGENGLSLFDDWCIRNNKNRRSGEAWAEFLHTMRGEDGQTVNGKDGLSAYEVWKASRPADVDTSEAAFWEFLKGKPGSNGHEGVDGKDGDTWKPYLSSDGKLYFENIRTKERTETIDITGPQGPGADRGLDGDTWEPFFSADGHKLFFKNQHGDIKGPFDVIGATGKRGPQGQPGESAYQIWLNEGNKGDFHDFLLWVAQQAQKGEDGKDGDTYIPHIEKGHLFFISSKTGKRIDGGYVVGPAGKQGDPGLNGHSITHQYGYQEIFDFKCPIQRIDPSLLASAEDLVSGASAEEHMRQTQQRINNIRKQGAEEKNRGSSIQHFFGCCSGADRKLLRMCPAEHSKYMGIGTVIFFTALMAMISSFFAISYVFGNADMSSEKWQTWLFSIAFAIMWGLMIFFLDRFITNTMYSDGKVTISWLELRSALPRILISIFLGIVISAPLELKIFEQEVTEQIISNRKEYLKKSLQSDTTSLKKEYNIISAEIDRRKGNIQTIKAYRHEVDSLGKVVKEAQNKVGNLKDNDQPRWNPKTDPDQTLYNKRLAAWQAGRKSNSESNLADKEAAGSGDKRKIDSLNNKIASLSAQLDTSRLVIERNEINNKIKSYVDNFDLKAKDDSLKSYAISSGLYEHLAALHAIAYQEDKEDGYHEWNWVKNWWWTISFGVFILLILVSLPFLQNVVKGDESEDGNTAQVNNPKTKGALVLYPWFAVTALICGYFANTLFNALPYYIFTAVGMIMMLFILIDVSPVFYKMMLADGQYEQYLHKEKSITQDLVRLNFAKSIAKVNESELGRLGPLIFSKPFKKIKKILDSVSSKKKIELGWEMTDENGKIIETANARIKSENRDLFEMVLRMKKAIIEASYQAWYRDMRDAIMGMHKPGFDDGGSGGTVANANTPPNIPPNSSSPIGERAGSDMPHGHYNSEDEPFSRDNYYGNRSGTSPDYDASSEDPYPGTPEDILRDEESRHRNPSYSNPDDTDDEDDDSEDPESGSETIEPEEDFMTSIEEVDEGVDSYRDNVEDDSNANTGDNSSTNGTSSSHPDSDVEREVIDDDDDDTIRPR